MSATTRAIRPSCVDLRSRTRGQRRSPATRHSLSHQIAGVGNVIFSFDTDTYSKIDTITFDTATIDPANARFTSWGSNGLAIASDESIIASGSFAGVEPSGPAPMFSPSATGSTNSTLGSVSYSIFNIGANNVVANPCTGEFYVATTGIATYGTAIAWPNSVLSIDPGTNTLTGNIHAGSEPFSLGLSTDCSYLYVGLYNSNSVQRLTTAPLQADLLIPLHSATALNYAWELDVAPGSPQTIAVAPNRLDPLPYLDDSSCGGLFAPEVIYDGAAPRPNLLGPSNAPPLQIVWGDSASIVYGTDVNDLVNDQSVLSSWAVDSAGFESRTAILSPMAPLSMPTRLGAVGH